MSTTQEALGGILRRMYDAAPAGEQVANIHFFGIKYASAIRDAELNPREVVAAAGINESYATEVNKGMNLSKYVLPRPEYQD